MNGYFPAGTSLEGGVPKIEEPKPIKPGLVHARLQVLATGPMTVASELMICQLWPYRAGLSGHSWGNRPHFCMPLRQMDPSVPNASGISSALPSPRHWAWGCRGHAGAILLTSPCVLPNPGPTPSWPVEQPGHVTARGLLACKGGHVTACLSQSRLGDGTPERPCAAAGTQDTVSVHPFPS